MLPDPGDLGSPWQLDRGSHALLRVRAPREPCGILSCVHPGVLKGMDPPKPSQLGQMDRPGRSKEEARGGQASQAWAFIRSGLEPRPVAHRTVTLDQRPRTSTLISPDLRFHICPQVLDGLPRTQDCPRLRHSVLGEPTRGSCGKVESQAEVTRQVSPPGKRQRTCCAWD